MDTTETSVNVKDLLPKELLEAVSERGLAALQESFNKLVESKVNAQIQTAVKSAEVSLDAALTERLEKLVTKLDENAKINLIRVVKKLNENHAAQLSSVKAKALEHIRAIKKNAAHKIATLKENYEVDANRQADRFRKSLTREIGKFITENIDARLPYKDIAKAVRNTKSMELLESFKRILNFDEVYQTESLKRPILEAYDRIEKGKKENEALAKKNANLEAKLQKASSIIAESERKAYLAKRLAEIPSKDQRMFVERVLEKASLQFIKDNFEYTCKQYRTNILKENAVLAEKTRGNAKSNQIAAHSRRELSRIMNENKKPSASVDKPLRTSQDNLSEKKTAWVDQLVKNWEKSVNS